MATRLPWDHATAQSIIISHVQLEGPLLPILHALQAAFGYIDAAATELIAEALNLSRAEVHGVITFYHDFRQAPAGQRIIKLCRAEACQAVGCEELVQHAAFTHNLAIDIPSTDGRITLESVYCLGNCALGPSALVDGELYARLDPVSLSALCQGQAVAAHSALDRA